MVHPTDSTELKFITHRIHGAAMYGNMDPVNIHPMLAYIPAPWILWVIFFKGLFGLSAYHGLSTSIMALQIPATLTIDPIDPRLVGRSGLCRQGRSDHCWSGLSRIQGSDQGQGGPWGLGALGPWETSGFSVAPWGPWDNHG